MDSLLSIVKLYNVCRCILFDYFRRFRLNLLHLDAKLTVLPPRGRLLETAQLKLMTLARRADRASPRPPDKSGFACDSNSYNKLYNVCYTGSSRKPEIHFLPVFFDTITLYVSCFSLFTINHEGITKAIPSYCYRRKKSHIKHTHLHMLFRKGMDKREALLRGGQHAAGRADPVEGTL